MLGEVRLVGVALDGAALEKLAVEHAIEVGRSGTGRAACSCRGLGHTSQFGRGGGVGVAGVAELDDIVLIVVALAAGGAFRRERVQPATHQDVRLEIEELLDDVVVLHAPARMRNHRGRRRVLDLGVGDDPHREAEAALHQTGNCLHPRIVERVTRAVAIDSHGVHHGFVPGRVGTRRIRGIGDDGIGSRGRDQCHVRHLVHRQLAERLAFGHALGEQPRGDAVRVRHAVADEQNDVIGLPLPGAVDLPRHFAGVGAVGSPHLVDARLGQRHAAQDQRRLVPTVLALH